MALAKHLQLPPSFVSKMLNGTKAIPAEHCRAIYAFVGGEVTLPEMRPDDWHKYWPELAVEPRTHQPADQYVSY